jgi:hypothetical protein
MAGRLWDSSKGCHSEKAALESCPRNLDEGQCPGSVAGQARDGEFPGGNRRKTAVRRATAKAQDVKMRQANRSFAKFLL